MIVAFENCDLVPDAWRSAVGNRTSRVFNPALLRDGDGWLFAYRVVAEPDLRRRIAVCRLDRNLRVIEGSQLPLSDWVPFPAVDYAATEATSWFADPRLYRLQGRLFVYWNSGWHEPRNYQFLQELDPTTCQPLGFARELTLTGSRQKLEKNWALFESNGAVYAVYSVNPHRVLALSLAGAGAIECHEIACTPNPHGYAQSHGGLRGGSPPQRVGDHYYSFCHSIEGDPTAYKYVPAVYRFAADAPFVPTDMPICPLPIAVPAPLRRRLPKLNPAVGDVLYPAGAAHEDGKWLVSLGVDDERCAIAVLDDAEVINTLVSTG